MRISSCARGLRCGSLPPDPMATALDRLRAHTFEERDASLPRPCVRDGRFVKVGVRGERFWCRVQKVEADGRFRAVVDITLQRSQWQRGHELVLQHEHVLESVDVADQLSFRRLLLLATATDSSDHHAAMLWPELRARGDRSCLNPWLIDTHS